MADFIDLAEISKRIRECLERSGCTAKEFAQRAEIPPATFSQIINGKQPVNVATINKIAEHFSETIDRNWLLFGDPTPTDAGGDLFSQHHPTQNIDASPSALALAQAEELGRLRELLTSSKPKQISHITVFYTDKSFDTFYCNEDH